ncbi:dienelactone hydrolase family protein [Viridibacillus sp. YIM B01967]|uniref:Dienelactone hydrolase family protein n=1 Tax=Viridibacillus soli TaxID=2798301 RepID=A0ABS1H2U6_9BACL|nr:dienelactone hydrolase family protein [Viridibacillus soli]MBK3493727.1 dienelactone hydrolase family protein [Viridibacillus soli]
MNSPFTFIHTEPKNMDATKQYPAIFLLHGMGSNEQDLPGLVADFQDNCHVFSLRGPIKHAPGYAFFTIEEFGKPDRPVFDKVVHFIREFIDEAMFIYKIDPTKVALMGFSQGAILAQSLALVLGDKLTAVIALSGYIPEFVKTEYHKMSVEHMPIFISHGEYDYVLPHQWGVESKEFFESLGADVTFKSYPDGHGVTPANQLDLITFLKEQIS